MDSYRFVAMSCLHFYNRFTGQERALELQSKLSHDISSLEERLVPRNFQRQIPAEYSSLPTLQGRATVQMVIKKSDGSQYAVEGKLYDKVKLKMVVDGYNAPITGGNFVDLVNSGFYNGKKVIYRNSACKIQYLLFQ